MGLANEVAGSAFFPNAVHLAYLPKMKNQRFWLVGLLALLASCQTPPTDQPADEHAGWGTYGGDWGARRYSSLRQITRDNVQQLQVAWTYRTGELDTANKTQVQCQPIVVDGVLYGVSPRKNVFALDAATGQERWKFLAKEHIPDSIPGWAGNTRGLAYWTDGQTKSLLATVGPLLFCLDVATGRPRPEFGQGGKIDLHHDLDHPGAENAFLVANSPGVIYKDLIIMGMRLSEGADAVPGHIRAYNVRTGKRAWIFHTIPHPGEPGYETWEDPNAWKTIGGANCWAGLTVDQARGLVFVPTGSATYDFYGGLRKGANLYANCLLALDAATGQRRWHFQFVHHDLWDRDLPTNPTLVTVRKNGQTIDAVAQPTKSGFVFVFNRDTGEPLFPIEERPVPDSDLPGEQAWPTQPVPTAPPPFARQQFREADISRITPASYDSIKGVLGRIAHDHQFHPPSLRGSIIFPGYDGGAEWGGASFDPQSGLLYVNANDVPWVLTMRSTAQAAPKPGTSPLLAQGQQVYATNCAMCHGPERKGNGQNYPSLLGLPARLGEAAVAQVINQGRNMMPAFKHLPAADKNALLAFLLDKKSTAAEEKEATPASKKAGPTMPYLSTGYIKFVDGAGYPAIAPPWGTLTAIDLAQGRLAWQVPLGELPELTKRGLPPTGTENYGGPATTAGGLLFIGATKDEKFRAFDSGTGKVLWQTDLPAAGYATPAVYQAQGRQFVVIACGGGKLGTKSGDSYVAFALAK